PELRGRRQLYGRWLRSRYPECFLRIPNQRTGMPVCTPSWQVNLARVTRFGWRQLQPYLTPVGLAGPARIRSYHDDERYWRHPDVRPRIEGTILRPGSLVCEILGRQAVSAVVRAWFERGAAPAQVVGSLYVFETYHRDLLAWLRAVRN